jgi:hypothetical protein
VVGEEGGKFGLKVSFGKVVTQVFGEGRGWGEEGCGRGGRKWMRNR